MKPDYYQMRLCDLPLFDVKVRLAGLRRQLQQELRGKGIHFRFHLYVSDEWFCPDGVPGIAVPFYLFHQNLAEIEKREMGFIEGRNHAEQMKYLRHELGHCIDNAFRLRRLAERKRVFGDSKVRYPSSYQPKKYSRAFVHYLGDNYAQSHPDEDFAETFAVWLDPNVDHVYRYEGTRAFEKLLFMDELMSGLAGEKQKLNNRFRIDPIEKTKITLRNHYYKKKQRMGLSHEKRIDQSIQHFFSQDLSLADERLVNTSVSQYLRREKKPLSKKIAEKTGAYTYQVQWAIERTIARAHRMKVCGTKEQLRQKAPLLIERNFRYLKEKQQLKHYL